MDPKTHTRLCHLYINEPDHLFDRGLKAEAELVAEELTRTGFPIRVQVCYGRGNEKTQWQQIENDRQATTHPDFFVVIPVNQDAIYAILSEIVSDRDDVTCVFLHQPLTRMMRAERERYRGRLFSVAADQAEIGRMQARQFAAVLPGGTGDILYLQGREHSYGTRHRTQGLLEELPRSPGVKLSSYRLFGDWSKESVQPALEAWTQLGGKLEWIQAAGAQNDDMAMALSALLRERGRRLPVIGVDGLETGKSAVDSGTLAATVVQPLGVGHAMRVFRDLLGGAAEKDLIPEDGNIVLLPQSYPSLDEIHREAAGAPRGVR
jgi:ABC-type sugar transport system substrate-binding protein